MLKRFRNRKPDITIKAKLINRLRKTSDAELIRWIDNIHTGLGMNITEMRKSLTYEDTSQALASIDDTIIGAVSMLAAMEVLLERVTKS